jgi:hypothetical protein
MHKWSMTKALIASISQSWKQHSVGQRNKCQYGYASVLIALDEPAKKDIFV